MKSKWVSGIGGVILIGGLLLATGVTPSAASQPASAPANPTLQWATNNPAASRFTTVFTGAVRDNNTGLVWEQAPDNTAHTWALASSYCVNKNVGGTVGWRLPSVIELKSVQDPSLSSPFLATGAFLDVQNTYWSATTLADNPTLAWLVSFVNGNVSTYNKTLYLPTWCVRGGMNADAY